VPSVLYVVSTPIGNLNDLSPRAVETLRQVDLVLAEDTRHSRPLLDRFGVTTPVESYHEHNEARATPRLVERLKAGDDIALITDAGTPLVSDPGARLVQAAIAAGVSVVAVPGPSALLAGLVASGLAADRFTFLGFLPRRGRERRVIIEQVLQSPYTVVVYEAPPRVGATLAELAEAGMADRHAAVARELTKQFEEIRRGTVSELARYYADHPPRGEVVLVIARAEPMAVPTNEPLLRERARALRATGVSARDVARALSEEHGVARNVAYRIASEKED
jgi:16S rRNA (cytidine1402-2'-O)-methyltransferase